MRQLAILATIVTLAGATLPELSQAVQLRDGKTYFVRPPRLVSATPTTYRATTPGVTYYFTLDLPETAGEPLRRVTIVQKSGGDRPDFGLNRTQAFEGTPDRPGAQLPLGPVTVDSRTREVSVEFTPPVAPGKTVTIALAPVQNPDVKGTYLFGVTAFPRGENPNGQFLGFGRFQIRRTRGT